MRWVGCIFRTQLRRDKQIKGTFVYNTNTKSREAKRQKAGKLNNHIRWVFGKTLPGAGLFRHSKVALFCLRARLGASIRTTQKETAGHRDAATSTPFAQNNRLLVAPHLETFLFIEKEESSECWGAVVPTCCGVVGLGCCVAVGLWCCGAVVLWCCGAARALSSTPLHSEYGLW